MDQNPQNPKKQFRNYIVFSGIAVQMGLTIYLGVLFGKWLDSKIASEKKYFTILFTLVSLLISIYSVVKQLKNFDESESKK